MKTKFFIVFSILIIVSVVFIGKIIAQESDQTLTIQYPIEELGNCENKADCKAYCDKSKNGDACLDFAQENNLMSDEEIVKAKKFLEVGGEGPGGCEGKDACETYCNDISHIDECIFFAEENDLIPPEELEEAKKVQAAIKRGVKPPPCGNKKACDIYCEAPEHMEECITFGIEAGFIRGKELEDVQKMLQAVKRGVKPPPCRGREACDEYCSSPDNMEVCMNFAMEAGFMSEQEKADSQKMLEALRKGIKPPPCKGREECDDYCGQEGHLEECMNFAVAAGFMSEEDAAMARKTGGKGPGGCKGKEECESFCNNPDNQETCFNFAKDNGMIPEEEIRKMEEGRGQMRQALLRAPAEVLDCLQGEIGADMVEKMKNGIMPPRDIGDKMQICFQKMGPPEGQMPPCEGENCPPPCEGENCKSFQPGPGEINPGGEMMPPQSGPGGCKTPEECQSFCQNNPEQCQNFRPPQGSQGEFQPSQPCEGEECKYGPPPSCEGENCGYGPPPEGQIPPGEFQPQYEGQAPTPCEGENCFQGPPPPDGSIVPPEGFAPEGDYMPPPPEPAPTGFIINTDSLVGSLIYAVFQFLTSQ